MLFNKIPACFVTVFLFVTTAFAQKDTIRIFQYNLLNYGDNDNPVSYKDPRLSTIIEYARPDIIGVNEVANSAAHTQNIKDNVLGAGWEKGTFVNTGNEIQTNMLFWKADKFALKSQKTVSYKLRDIIAFQLYYKDPNLEQTHDTIFLTVIVAHLKAGNTTQDKNERAAETQTVVNYLNSMGKNGNYIFMGDFNLYSSNEVAYANLVNNPNANGRLYDPINRPGDWSGNSAFAGIHTQSTRTSGMPDGGATGGLDDRFDHMLVSNDLLNNISKCMYLQGSYAALGQDGKHFNKSVNASPANAVVPANVAQALYEMSDHLPIYADFVIEQSLFPSGIKNPALVHAINNARITNPFNDKLIFSGIDFNEQDVFISIYTADGRTVLQKRKLENTIMIVPTDWQPGIYIVRLQDSFGRIVTSRLVKR